MPSGRAPRPPRSSAGATRASCRYRSFRSKPGRDPARAGRRLPGLFLRGLVERDGERSRVGDLDEVADLHQIEVLRIPRLDGLRVALRPLDRDGPGLLVDLGDGGRDRDLLADRAGRRLAGLRADPALLHGRTWRRGTGLLD